MCDETDPSLELGFCLSAFRIITNLTCVTGFFNCDRVFQRTLYRDHDSDKAILIENENCLIRETIVHKSKTWRVRELAFRYLPLSIQSFTIPSWIEFVAADAFLGCDWLIVLSFESACRLCTINGFANCRFAELEILDSVEIIGERAFAGCIALSKLYFTSCTSIREIHGFQECGLKKVEIPARVEIIGRTAFVRCLFLEIIIFQRDATLVALSGFAETSVETVIIPASVSVIGPGGFDDCRKLSRIVFTPGSLIPRIKGFHRTLGGLEFPDSLGVFLDCYCPRQFLVLGQLFLQKMR
jgi:hypothetical protein